MENVLHAMQGDRRVSSLNVEDAFDPEDVAPQQGHQHLEPAFQSKLTDGVIDGEAERTNSVAVAVYVLLRCSQARGEQPSIHTVLRLRCDLEFRGRGDRVRVLL
ncbi:hypothetical protein D3C81_1822080 [compost metagenome]